MSERRAGAVLRAGRALVLVGALLLLAELATQTWGRYLRTPYESYDRDHAVPVLVPGVHTTRFGQVEINAHGFVGAPLSAEPSPASRIMALGDSCTFGGGDRNSTWPAMLQESLKRSVSAAGRYEVVNAGISGLTPEEGLRRLVTTLPALQPEVVTIYLGWNDLMKLSPRAQTTTAPLAATARWLDRLWLARGVRKGLYFYIRPALSSPRTGPESRTGRFAYFNPSYFEENLLEILHAVHASGARPLLLTLPHSLRRDMTPMDLARLRVQFPYFMSSDSVGDFVDLIESYNAAIRRIGIAQEVAVTELAGAFEQLGDPRPYFLDTMHTNTRGMALIAGLVERSLIDAQLLTPGSGSIEKPWPAHRSQ